MKINIMRLLIISAALNVLLLGFVFHLNHKVSTVGIQRKEDAEKLLDQAQAALEQSQAALMESDKKLEVFRQETAKFSAQYVSKERPSSPSKTSSSPVKTDTKVSASEHQKNVATISQMKSAGMILSINNDSHEVVVDPAVWSRMTYEQKGGMTAIVSEYLNYVTGYSHVTVVDKYSHKKVGSLGVFGGFKVY